MEIWLKQSGGKLRIPVLPSSYQVSSGQTNTSVNINSLGEVSLLGKRNLITVSFSSFLPSQEDSYCEYRGVDRPKEYIDAIENMKRSGVVRLHITGILSMSVTIETLDYEENDGTGDISYTLSMKEHRRLNIPTSMISGQTSYSQVGGAAREVPAAQAGRTHIVKEGESLSSIARKETGSSSWRAIYEANKNIIGSNPNLIYPGQVLMIP